MVDAEILGDSGEKTALGDFLVLRNLQQLAESNGGVPNQELLVQHLIRLDSATYGAVVDRPIDRLNMALETRGLSRAEVAKKYKVGEATVRRAVRDTVAAWIYSMGNCGDFPVSDEMQKRIDLLGQIDAELAQGRELLRLPEMKEALGIVWHVGDLVDEYLKFRTVRHLLDGVGVNYTPYQMRSVRRFLWADNTENALDGLAPLARKYLFALWTKKKGTSKFELTDGYISQAAEYLFQADISGLPREKMDRIRTMRAFLAEMMRQEVEVFGGASSTLPDTTDSAELYTFYAENNYCPAHLFDYAQLLIGGASQPERIGCIFPGQVYSDEWRAGLDWAGLKFLEHALLWSKARPELSLDLFTFDVGTVLKQAKMKVLGLI